MISQLPEAINLNDAPAYWFLNALHVLLAHNQSERGAYSLIHLSAPAGLETPYHVHEEEDEAFYVLEGNLTIIVAGQSVVSTRGSYVFLPRKIPHGFRCTTDAKILIHVMPGGKLGFIGMMLELAVPISDRENLPSTTSPDLKRLVEVCEKNEIHVLGPLPNEPESDGRLVLRR
jgi:quercetin dioxygenase-like cupin family protein